MFDGFLPLLVQAALRGWDLATPNTRGDIRPSGPPQGICPPYSITSEFVGFDGAAVVFLTSPPSWFEAGAAKRDAAPHLCITDWFY